MSSGYRVGRRAGAGFTDRRKARHEQTPRRFVEFHKKIRAPLILNDLDPLSCGIPSGVIFGKFA